MLKIIKRERIFTNSKGQHHLNFKTRKRHNKERNYRRTSLMNTGARVQAKIKTKKLPSQIQPHIKIIIHWNHVRFIPGMKGYFSICKSKM